MKAFANFLMIIMLVFVTVLLTKDNCEKKYEWQLKAGVAVIDSCDKEAQKWFDLYMADEREKLKK